MDLKHKSKKWLRLASVNILTLVVGTCTSAQATEPISCSVDSIAQTNDPIRLNRIARECLESDKLQHFVVALTKLNELSPVAGKKIQLQTFTPPSKSEQVTFALDLYFDILRAYPPKAGTDKLDELIEKLNETDSIKSVHLIGSRTRGETNIGIEEFARLAHKRADFIKRYLIAAGMQSNVPVEILESGPKHPDTLEGQARDRSVSIKVVTQRRRAGTYD